MSVKPETSEFSPKSFTWFWFFLYCLVVTPLVPGLIWLGKNARRGKKPQGPLAVLTVIFSGGIYAAIMFLLPLQWYILILIHLLICIGFSFFFRYGHPINSFKKRDGTFIWQFQYHRKFSPVDFRNQFLGTLLALLPLFYLVLFLWGVAGYNQFGVELPAQVLLDAIVGSMTSIPVAAIAAFFLSKANFNLEMKHILWLLTGALILYLWSHLWESLHYMILAKLEVPIMPLFFPTAAEERFRTLIKWFCYAGGMIIGLHYLIGAKNSGIFFRRCLFLGPASLVFVVTLFFYTGDWNYYLEAMKNFAWNNRYGQVSEILTTVEARRTPSFYSVPRSLNRQMEKAWLQNNQQKALRWQARLEKNLHYHPQNTELIWHVKRIKNNWKENNSHKKSSFIKHLPVISPAEYLDQNWYGLLSVIAWLNPQLDDLGLKKKLLKLSPHVQMVLPDLGQMPEMVPILQQLKVPHSYGFPGLSDFKKALKNDLVPFVFYQGRWIPITGYDINRGGFYYYDYRERSIAVKSYQNTAEDILMPERSVDYKVPDTTLLRAQVRRFMPGQQLKQHLKDIGGVGLILGDNQFFSENEQKAAYDIELGDALYQSSQPDFALAAKRYLQAFQHYPSDIVKSRMLFLIRRHKQLFGDPRDFRQMLIRENPSWISRLELKIGNIEEIRNKMLNGDFGVYLLSSWFPLHVEKGNAAIVKPLQDTLQHMYQTLIKLHPENPEFRDSLATLYCRSAKLDSCENLLTELVNQSPPGEEWIHYRLAWTKFRSGKLEEAAEILKKCPSFNAEPRYLTILGKYKLNQGKNSRGMDLLEQSLKSDLTLLQTHEVLHEYYLKNNMPDEAKLHATWIRRLKPGGAT